MILLGIQEQSYTSQKTNEEVKYFNLTFKVSSDCPDTMIGECCNVYRCNPKALQQCLKAEGYIELSDLLHFDYTFTLDKYRNIVALYTV